MILIVDSGATKTAWCLCDSRTGEMDVRQTHGINVSVMSRDKIGDIVSGYVAEVGPETVRQVSSIFFYGAGIISEESVNFVRSFLSEHFPSVQDIHAGSDLLAAARALFGHQPGIAAILGTGSNSCLYDGERIVRNIRPGGFILGDEGSGAVLGRLFLSDYLKGLVPEELANEFHRRYGVDYASAVKEVYKGGAPSRYLAGFARFVVEHADEAYAAGLIRSNFTDFIDRCLLRYGQGYEVGVIGSFGAACRDILQELGRERGVEFTRFAASPLDGLMAYHLGRR